MVRGNFSLSIWNGFGNMFVYFIFVNKDLKFYVVDMEDRDMRNIGK